MSNIVKVVVYMSDIKKFEEMNKAYRQYFEDGEEPVRVAIQAQSPLPGIDIEIEVTAIVDN